VEGWLRGEAAAALGRGTRVCLYFNGVADVVGYGSLGQTRWRYPHADSPKTALVIVPAVAVRRVYWGKPDGPQGDRYSSQIMQHPIDESFAWPGSPPELGLFVHPDNLAAIKPYARYGFRPYFHTYADPASGVIYPSYLRPLARG